jgi:hypothetical protein
VSKYEYIDSQKSEPTNPNSVVKMCLWLAVSTCGLSHWAIRPQSATAARREALSARIQLEQLARVHLTELAFGLGVQAAQRVPPA